MMTYLASGIGLVLYSEAVWNTTEGPSANGTECHYHGNGDNCTDTDTGQWDGHFSTCPLELTYYCIHGSVVTSKCEPGFVGSRCELLDFDWLKDERRQIIIICVSVGLVLLILLLRLTEECVHSRFSCCLLSLESLSVTDHGWSLNIDKCHLL
uniref:EGF-like domain-containing protein n=1 Tax=Neogobius melanostomus TaxID=47308 RepID=A0A8C6S3F8_9GOBI